MIEKIKRLIRQKNCQPTNKSYNDKDGRRKCFSRSE